MHLDMPNESRYILMCNWNHRHMNRHMHKTVHNKLCHIHLGQCESSSS